MAAARQRLLLCVACAATLLAAATALPPPARGAVLELKAASGGRLHAHISGAPSGTRLTYRLDGRRLRRARGTEAWIRLGRRHTAPRRVRWRTLAVRRASSQTLLARTRFAAVRARKGSGPTVVLIGAPPATTASTSAEFSFSASTEKTSCRLDAAALVACSSPVTYSGLAAGQHSFTVQAGNGSGTTSITTAWTITSPAALTTGSADGTSTPSSSTSSSATSSTSSTSTGSASTTSTSSTGNSTSGAPPTASGATLVFEDNFDGTVLNTNAWTPYNSAGNGGNGLRRPSAFSLDGNGNLVVTAQMVNGQLVSGGMSNKINFTYGRVEFRVRTEPDPTATMSGVVLTWPQSENWPTDGENDMYETLTAANTRSPFYSFVHYGPSNQQYWFRHEADASQWHTITMDWGPQAIKIYRDGALVWTVTDVLAIPDVAHHVCIQLDATATRTLTTPVHMYVDYVRIYKLQ